MEPRIQLLYLVGKQPFNTNIAIKQPYPQWIPRDDLNVHIFLSRLQSLRMNTRTTTLPQPNLVMSRLGLEFRQGAANPTLWESDDERLSRWQSCRERDQPISHAGPLKDSEPGTVLFPTAPTLQQLVTMQVSRYPPRRLEPLAICDRFIMRTLPLMVIRRNRYRRMIRLKGMEKTTTITHIHPFPTSFTHS